MPRGGGRGGGARKQGPDLAWDDEEPTPIFLANKPAPTFPEIAFPIPRPFSHSELDSIDKYLSFRARARNGPYFAALDPSSLTDDNGKVAPRAGFDPFNDQEAYSSRFQKKKRTVPEVNGNIHALQLFPKELWPVIDPKRKNPLWETLDPAELNGMKTRKRKRRPSATAEVRPEAADGEDDSDADSDAVVSGRRKQKTEQTRKREKDAKQRRGLDAEDDYPEGEPNADEEGEGEDEPEDSEFDESEDEDNDYNAENYFDGGDDDDMGGGDDDDGGGGNEWYS